MTSGEILATLGPVRSIEWGCVVPEEPGEVVRVAAPLDERARAAMREQQIARLVRDAETGRG